jgi:hypothetical protein
MEIPAKVESCRETKQQGGFMAKKGLFNGLVLSVVLSIPVASHANTITYPIGQASTVGFANGALNGETARGWDFTVNAAGVVVDQLGVNAGTTGTSLYVTLWDDSSMMDLGQVQVTSQANTWVFANLALPVNLTLGHTYAVIGWGNVQIPWYIFNNTPPAAFDPTGVIQYLDTRVGNNIDQNTFPGNNGCCAVGDAVRCHRRRIYHRA